MIIAFDIDDVLADLVPAWLAKYNADYQDTLKRQDITAWDITQFVKPACGTKIYDYLSEDLYDNVQPLPGALDAVRLARKCGKVIFVTSCHPSHMGRKFRWLNNHGFNVTKEEYVECSDKSLILADIMIDDNPVNLEGFHGKEKILYDQPWNRDSSLSCPRLYGFGDLKWLSLLKRWEQSPGTSPEDLKTKAVKYDVGKPRMELLSPWVLIEVAKVMTHGAVKYQDHNWRNGFNWTRPIGASLRHISAWLQGEDLDPEWDLPHLAHAICCLMFTLEHQLLKMGVDDRWRQNDY